MAMNMAGSSGGGGRRGRRAAVMAEINVTPMVDVMLVLLIIFMVAAPLMTSTIDIDLPNRQRRQVAGIERAAADAVGQAHRRQLQFEYRTVSRGHPISAAELLPKIKAIRETRSDAESVVYLRGDKDVCYTDMMKLLGISGPRASRPISSSSPKAGDDMSG